MLMLAIPESAVLPRSTAILLAMRSGNELPLAKTMMDMAYLLIPEKSKSKS